MSCISASRRKVLQLSMGPKVPVACGVSVFHDIYRPAVLFQTLTAMCEEGTAWLPGELLPLPLPVGSRGVQGTDILALLRGPKPARVDDSGNGSLRQDRYVYV
jgi:hypothetical protein